MIMEEFDEIQEKMAEGGVHIQVVHAGIISDKEIKLPLPTKIDPEALFWSDPMTKLKRFAADTGFRLIDVFKQFDKDNSWTVDREEFIMGVKVSFLYMFTIFVIREKEHKHDLPQQYAIGDDAVCVYINMYLSNQYV